MKENSRGFTLFEVLVALLIVSISIATILSAFGMSSKNILRAEEEREVARYVEQLFLELELNSGLSSKNLSNFALPQGWTYSYEIKDVFLDDIKSENYQGLKEVTLYVFSPVTNREYKFITWIATKDGFDIKSTKKEQRPKKIK